MITPSFQLDFTSAVLDPGVSFARALNTATRVNSSGLIESVNADVARFDYNPVTLSCIGLLIEEARTNIFINSANFSATWAATNITVSADAAISPDGTQNADNLIATAGVSEKYIGQAFAASATTYTFSVFLKSSGRQFVQLFWGGSSQYVNIDLTNGVIAAGSYTAASVQSYGDGWYRCRITSAITAGTRNAYISHIDSGSATRNVTSTGDGVNGVYAFGGQLEQATFPTSYIPTTTTALTRNADVATITGTAFSGFWRSGPGSILVRALPSTVSGTRPWVQVDDTTANEIIALRGNTTNPELYIVDGGSPQAQIDAGTIAANTAYRLAGAWATNSCAASLNGGTAVLDGAATIPTVTQMRLGSDGTNYLNGHLQSLEYYDVRLSNADLQTVSSTAGYQSIVQPVLKNTIVSDIITELV